MLKRLNQALTPLLNILLYKTMIKIQQLAELRKQISHWKQQNQRIAFVPTMGNLHQGHLTLIKEARQHADKVCCSIFVNPLQFGEGEDFECYPRTPEQDFNHLLEAGADLLFEPSVELIYPRPLTESTKVEVPILSNLLCGISRPHHFVGVTTIVCKLFNMVMPDIAVFGNKDYQQLFIIRRMVADLNSPIEIMGLDTVREADGLAMSSRNYFLNAEQRKTAPLIYQQLQATAKALKTTPIEISKLSQQKIAELNQAGFKTDYFEIRDAETLQPANLQTQKMIILVAAQLGQPRLIDNLLVQRINHADPHP